MREDDPRHLMPASPDELRHSLAFGLNYAGGKRTAQAGGLTAMIAAERLVEHLRLSGYVIMKKPPSPAPAVGRPPPAGD